ncbi:MAG: efflux RND transporter permease subunit [Methylococcaceae bacterium]|nr:efflux RND transporter permease subunit [Methylococcaceae bacterium]
MLGVVRFSLKQKVFFNLVFILLTVVGFYAMFQLPAERYPNVNFGEVNITTYYPGASPTEVETLITRKIEEEVETVANIEWISSTSYAERSHIRLKFIDDTDYPFLFNEVRFKVLNMLNELPEAVDPPSIDDATVDDLLPVIAINLAGQHSNRALVLMAEQVKARIQKIANIKEVELTGEYIREFHVYLDTQKLRQYGVSFNEVVSALKDANISMPAGSFKSKNSNYLVKVDEKFHSRSQVINTIIRKDGDGSFIRLEDLITKADLGYRDPLVISTVNGKDVIALRVIKTKEGNAIDIREAIIHELNGFTNLFEQEKLEVTLTQDSTNKIKDGFTTLGLNMLLGMFLVSIIIWYFMGIRNAGLVTIGIPFSFMITMLLMYITGNSLNEISLFAFVLVTGIIVDDAIVVCENIYRHIQEGCEVSQAIVTGTAEVGLPVIASTLTTVAAFLPMLIMTGATGDFFAQIPIAVTFALIASLIECLVILPIHYLSFGPRQSKVLSTHLEEDNFILAFVRSVTNKALSFTLKHRVFSVFSIFFLLFLAMSILAVSASGKIPLINIKFFPDDYTVYYADITGSPEIPIEAMDKKVREVANFIMADGEGFAESAAGFAGFYPNEDYEPVYGNNFGTVMVTMPMKDKQEFSHPLEHLEDMRKRLKTTFENNGFVLSIHAQKDGPPTGKDVNVRIVGTQFDSISGLADEILHFFQTKKELTSNLVELHDGRGEPKQLYRFEIKHEKVKEYNLSNTQVTQLAGSVLDGRYIGKYRLNDEEIDLKVLIDPLAIKIPRQALTIPVIEHASGPVRLGDVTELRTYFQPGELQRYQGQRAVSITANIKPEAELSSPTIIALVKDFYAKIENKYPGASLIFGGEHEDTQRSYTSLMYAFIIAIMIMYIVLAAQFQSYLQPIIILSAIAFALIGVVIGKLVFQSLFTVNSFIAIIGVAGVVVNDSLILVDFMNKLYREGETRIEAVNQAIKVRLRPIILTTLTTTLGLLPMALGFPEESIVWGAMASTFVSGLAVATILTLFIAPVLWDMIQERQEKKLARGKITDKANSSKLI